MNLSKLLCLIEKTHPALFTQITDILFDTDHPTTTTCFVVPIPLANRKVRTPLVPTCRAQFHRTTTPYYDTSILSRGSSTQVTSTHVLIYNSYS